MDGDVFFIRARSGRNMPTQVKRLPTIEGIRDFVRSFIRTHRIICDAEQIIREVKTNGRVALSKVSSSILSGLTPACSNIDSRKEPANGLGSIRPSGH